MYYPDKTAENSLGHGIPTNSSFSSLQPIQNSHPMYPSQPGISFDEYSFPPFESSLPISTPHPTTTEQMRNDIPFSLSCQHHFSPDEKCFPNYQAYGTGATHQTPNSSYSSESSAHPTTHSTITTHFGLTSPQQYRSKSVIGSTQKGRHCSNHAYLTRSSRSKPFCLQYTCRLYRF